VPDLRKRNSVPKIAEEEKKEESPQELQLQASNSLGSKLHKPRCLIANDEEVQLMILDLIMTKHGFKTECCINGYDAFVKVQESLNNPDLMFDLVILDLNMPICGGQEACSRIDGLYNESIMFKDKAFVKLSAEQVINHMVVLPAQELLPNPNIIFEVPV